MRSYPVREVSRWLGVSTHSLYKWMKLFGDPAPKKPDVDHEAENRRLKRELVRVTKERDILKRQLCTSREGPNEVRLYRGAFGVRAMCRVLRVHFSGFYAWLKEPLSHRAQEDIRQTDLIRQAWADSGKVYGYRKLADDLRDQGERVSENRVARLASLVGIAAQVGYRRRPGRYGGKPAIMAANRLEQRFEASAPDQVWVTDITCIKTMKAGCISVSLSTCSRAAWSAGRRTRA